MIFGSTNQLFFPHITVWGSCFSLGSRRGSRLLRPLLSHHSHITTHHSFTHHSFTHHFFSHLTSHILTSHTSHPHFSHLTHHSSTSHTSLITSHAFLTPHLAQLARGCLSRGRRSTLITSQLITAPLLTPHLSHLTSHSPIITSHSTLLTYHCHRSCQASLHHFSHLTHHRGSLSRGRRSTQSLLVELWRAWAPLARGCLLRGKRSTQSLLEELRRAWAPLAAQFAAEAKGIPWQRTRGGPRTRSNGRRSEFESSFYSTTAPCPNRLRPWDAEWQNGGFMGLLQLLEQWLVKPGKMANCSPSRSTIPTRFTKWKNIWCESKWWRLNLRGISWKELACCMSSPGVRYIRASHVGLSGPFIPISIIHINMND